MEPKHIIQTIVYKIYIMTHLFKTTFIFLLIANYSCYAQQMVKTTNDAKKLELNEKQFIGRPLKTLLKEINPKIERVIGSPGNIERPGYFIFYFIPNKDYNLYRKKNKIPLTVKVYIKEPFEWNRRNKPKNNWLDWTIEDEKKYGDLTIGAIRVYGEN